LNPVRLDPIEGIIDSNCFISGESDRFGQDVVGSRIRSDDRFQIRRRHPADRLPQRKSLHLQLPDGERKFMQKNTFCFEKNGFHLIGIPIVF
jgi:hypothetical protein